jgi:glycolate oxidase iron-sulfur subunit
MLRLAPWRPPARSRLGLRQVFAAQGARHGRVMIQAGCANDVLAPAVNRAAIRVLTRHGVEVVQAEGEGCCGALVHHMGREDAALAQVRANVAAWSREIDAGEVDAIVITASGCGTHVKDYGYLLRNDPAYARQAAQISAKARDITEYLHERALVPTGAKRDVVVAYHSACSLQHGQKVTRLPKELLSKFGFVVKDVPEAHLCCGSAGTYNMLQPQLAQRLRERKVRNIETLKPDVIAAGNLGCMTQIAAGTNIPVVHTIELIDWATGGPRPAVLAGGSASAGPTRSTATAS